MKPGYKTTEFWLSAVVTICGLLVASGVIESGGPWDKAIALITSTLAQLGYASARATAKAGEIKAE